MVNAKKKSPTSSLFLSNDIGTYSCLCKISIVFDMYNSLRFYLITFITTVIVMNRNLSVGLHVYLSSMIFARPPTHNYKIIIFYSKYCLLYLRVCILLGGKLWQASRTLRHAYCVVLYVAVQTQLESNYNSSSLCSIRCSIGWNIMFKLIFIVHNSLYSVLVKYYYVMHVLLLYSFAQLVLFI